MQSKKASLINATSGVVGTPNVSSMEEDYNRTRTHPWERSRWKAPSPGSAGEEAKVTSWTPSSQRKQLLTVEEVAEILGIGRTFAYQLVRRGELPSIKLGKCRKVHVESLQRFIERLAAESREDPTCR